MIATANMIRVGATVTTGVHFSARGDRPAQPPPARQALRPDELVGAINGLLALRPECEGLEVEAGRLAPGCPDVDGCNWRVDGLRLRVAHGPSTRALSGVHQAVELARLRYELLDG